MRWASASPQAGDRSPQAGDRSPQAGDRSPQAGDRSPPAGDGAARAVLPPGRVRVRPGVRLGVDVGAVRVGVARSDPSGILATPIETVPRDVARGSDLARIAGIVAEWGVVEVIVGLPRGLSGRDGDAAAGARKYAVAIAHRVRPVPVRVVDERLSTVTAQRSLREAGVKGRRHRPVVDQAAAVVILQFALDAEQVSGRAPGSLVEPGDAPERPSQR